MRGLIVAKLDRLARSVQLWLESGWLRLRWSRNSALCDDADELNTASKRVRRRAAH
jgi:hypothetical protein